MRKSACEAAAKRSCEVSGEHAIWTTDRSRNRAWLFWCSLGLSLAIHVAVAAHLLSRDAQDFGETDITTTAISVNIEATDILDAAEQSAATDAAQAPASPPGEPAPTQEAEPEKAEEAPPRHEPEMAEAEPQPSPPPPEEQTVEKANAETPPAIEQQAAEEARAREDEEALRRASDTEREKQEADRLARDKAGQLAEEQARVEREQQARAKREVEARNARKKRRAEKAEQGRREAKEKRARTAANAGASGSRGAKASTGRVSASQGDMRNYQGIVNAWIARNKPPHSGGRGDVVVLLALSPSGALLSARVVSSSGTPALDQIALAAVRRSSPFPKPPAGSTAGQLRFTFPYRFR